MEHSPSAYPQFNKHCITHYIDKKHTDNNFVSLYNVLCSRTVGACSCVLTELTWASQAQAAGVEARRVRRDGGAAARLATLRNQTLVGPVDSPTQYARACPRFRTSRAARATYHETNCGDGRENTNTMIIQWYLPSLYVSQFKNTGRW